MKKPNADLGIKKPNADLGIKKPNADLGPQGKEAAGGIDLSVCNLKKSREVTDAMKALVALLRDKLRPPVDINIFVAILGAHAVSQSYFNRDFTDLYDFCRALGSFCSNEEIRKRCQSVMDAIKIMCPTPRNCGRDVRNSHGVSIFFPWNEWDEDDLIVRYKDLEFLIQTEWNVFLKEYRELVNDFETNPDRNRVGLMASLPSITLFPFGSCGLPRIRAARHAKTDSRK